MSQTSIGKAALILTTDASGMTSGLSKELKSVEGQVSASNSRLAAAGKSVGGGGGGMLGGLISAAPKALAAAGVVVGGVASISAAMDTLKDVAAADAASKAFGLSIEKFSGMAGVAASVGEGQREFIESLVTLGKVASEGAAGKGEVAAAFFEDLNLSAKEFAGLSLDEQFYSVFEAIQKVEDPAKRVRALMTAFGEDGGKYLLPLLSKAPSEIRAMGSSLAISAEEARKATQANQALQQAGTALSTAWRKIAVAFAPVVTAIASGTARLAPLFDWIGRAASAIGEIMGAVWTEVTGAIASAVQAVGEWIGSVSGITGPWPTVQEVVVGVFRVVGTAGALCWDTLKAGVGAVAIAVSLLVDGFGVLVTAFRHVVSLAQVLPDEVRPTWINDLVAGTKDFEDSVHRGAAKMREWGANAITGWGKSGLQFNDWLDRLLVKKPAEAAAAVGKAAGDASAKAMKKVKENLDNKAMQMGTTDEVTARLKHDFGGKTVQDQMVDQQKKANGLLKDVVNAVKAIGDKFLPGVSNLIPL